MSTSNSNANLTQKHELNKSFALSKVLVGSASLWSWGFLCYLSPIVFPLNSDLITSTGLEFGFFASQITVVIAAIAVVLLSRFHRIRVTPALLLVAAILVALSPIALTWALEQQVIALILLIGFIDGISVTLLGSAWGARYSLGSRSSMQIVVISFLIAYIIYLIVSQLPSPGGFIILVLLPILSWAFWMTDAISRQQLSLEVFPAGVTSQNDDIPGELQAGSWETRVLPWRTIGAIMLVSFIGNFISSLVIGNTYTGVQGIFYGGVIVSAIIAILVLIPFVTESKTTASYELYRVTLTLSVIGLIIIIVFGEIGVGVGGALIQGCAIILQVLIFVLVTRSTQEHGIAPLLSFTVGQGVISAIVFLGNMLGKQVFNIFSLSTLVLSLACGVCILALFVLVISRSNMKGFSEVGLYSEQSNVGDSPAQRPIVEKIVEPMENKADQNQRVLDELSERFGLTKREREVLEYLSKGRSLPFIADELFVTTGTIKTHTSHIYRKLGINSRQELIDLYEASDEAFTSD